MNSNATTNTTGPEIADAAAGEMNKLIADVEEVIGKAAHIVDLDVTKLRESVLEKIAAAKAGLSTGRRRITEAASTAGSATDTYVQHHPWQAIGFAAALGAAVGYLLARR